ncbi:unnamed protein product [Lepeophtheirus salmonis]|uniref:(salmon louse) hypothetical protein n=1 Tax=Lepeophtheirus salmonis TaxID=72036 RepID=A0A7R8H4G7_LEPSM|nr:unnamed protein product [Lepeophtheirus salmonis]CAF2862233.1 unnamed protein product [Lepeophtheirus salmonis]
MNKVKLQDATFVRASVTGQEIERKEGRRYVAAIEEDGRMIIVSTSTVCGQEWLDDYIENMRKSDRMKIKEFSTKSIYTFGNHQKTKSKNEDQAVVSNWVFNNRNDDSKWKGTCEIIGKDGKVYFVRHGGCRIRCHVCMLQKRCEDTKKGCKTKMFQCRRQRNVVEARIEDENAIASHVEDISNSNEKDVSSKHDENPNVGDKRKRGCPTNGKYRRFYNIRYHCSGEECCVDIDTWKEVDDLLLPSGGR